jgi:hypothetical protein
MSKDLAPTVNLPEPYYYKLDTLELIETVKATRQPDTRS